MSNSEYLLMKKTRCLSSTRNGPCIEQPKIVKSFKLRAIFGHFELQPQPNTTVFPSPQPPNVVSFLVPVYFPCACARLSLLLLSGLVLLPIAPCTLNVTMTRLLTFPIQVSPTGSSSARRHITVVPPPHPCPAPPSTNTHSPKITSLAASHVDRSPPSLQLDKLETHFQHALFAIRIQEDIGTARLGEIGAGIVVTWAAMGLTSFCTIHSFYDTLFLITAL